MNYRIRKPFNARLALILPALALGASAFSAPQAQAKPAAKIAWRTSLPAAMKEAQRLRKPLMVDFFATWCGPCKMLDAQTYTDKKVIAESKNFVSVHIDVDKNQALAQKYKVNGIPNILFLRPDGSVAQSEVGFIEPAEFVKKMRTARVKAAKRASSRL